MSGVRCISSSPTFGISRKIFYNLSTHWHKRHCILEKKSLALHSFNTRSNIHNATRHFCGAINKAESSSEKKKIKKINFAEGPDLVDFILNDKRSSKLSTEAEQIPYVKPFHGNNRKVYFDIYGCQMNVNDTEVIWSILEANGYSKTDELLDADVVLVITCSIRDGAEQKVWKRLEYIKSIKLKKKQILKREMRIGLLGCMAERLKQQVVEKNKLVDLVAGPDSYKDLPRLLAITDNNEMAINVMLSFDETYADVMPVRLNPDAVTAFVSIMRGCDNICTYCIVPFTRGRERSRPITSILDEIRHLSDEGVKEVTLLGQNVNSYRDISKSEFFTGTTHVTNLAKGFKTVYKSKIGGLRFSDLLDKVSLINSEMRIRFTSPHPKDFPDEVLQLIAERPNICNTLHLPAQSGNSRILERMRRGYSREAYLELVEHVRTIIPNVSLTSDFIVGFCGETEEEFNDTLSLMEIVKYNMAYMFAYSMREKTKAHRRYEDDVSAKDKSYRLKKLIQLYRTEVEKINQAQIGQQQLILVEGISKRGNNFQGRNDGNTKVIIPNGAIPENCHSVNSKSIMPGDYVVVQICNANSQLLTGIPLYHSSISEFTISDCDNRKHRAVK
ncbi:CDK5RAP1-like protein [Cephus cinctus]|uniref:CDK5RAP1-like protein n=1 Tax=Cephus cinctus TaxID=211228 RepID=A0AAJ7CAZ7_CEPCN|nr:CDK5RAP1-like protein [Cephus cinctus]